jgi:hypothetical protein
MAIEEETEATAHVCKTVIQAVLTTKGPFTINTIKTVISEATTQSTLTTIMVEGDTILVKTKTDTLSVCLDQGHLNPEKG